MKITFISLSDNLGGAAITTRRLAEGLRAIGHDAVMLVGKRSLDLPWIKSIDSPARLKECFLIERAEIFAQNGFSKKDLFKVSSASCGLPLWKNPDVTSADAVVLGWFNQGLLSLEGIRRILSLGKPVIWMMHDLWTLSGICHHPGKCTNFLHGCGKCPFLHFMKGKSDLSARTFKKKSALYGSGTKKPHPIFTAVSRWVVAKAKSSPLLKDAEIELLPNGLDLRNFGIKAAVSREKLGLPRLGKIVVMGAARLDDPIKGLPMALDALNRLQKGPMAGNVTAVFFGSLKNPHALDSLAIPYLWLGPVNDLKTVESIYIHSDVVISSSFYETFGATLCEGMAAGCVPVSFDSGGPSDIFEHLKTGWLAKPFDPADLTRGIEWALSSGPDKNLLRQNALAFDIRKIASDFISLLERKVLQP